MERAERRRLLAALRHAVPWLTSSDAGPQAVTAGQCDRCDARPRLLPTCGPTAWTALCRDCALTIGTEGWCDGHHGHALELLTWARDLPPWWGDAIVLWWVATGEVDGPPTDVDPALPAAVRSVLSGR